jgi:HTH-type transcriptional regulator/antitoxin HigA
MNALVKQAIEHWQFVAPILTKPTNEIEYDALVNAMDDLLDVAGDDESHPLSGLIDYMGDLVSDYEQRLHPIAQIPSEPKEILRFLMEQHHLKQSDLPEVGNQSVVSGLLSGQRSFNLRHIESLTKRFGVSAELFI